MATRGRAPVSIGGRKFVIDLAGYQREGVDSSRQMVDQGAEPGEQSLSNRGIWKRTSEDFVHGVGQMYYDHTEDNLRSRFHASTSIDPWTRRELKLHHKTRVPLASAGIGAPFAFGAGQPVVLAGASNQRFITSNPTGTALNFYWVAANAVVKVDDPTAATWTMTQVGGNFPLAFFDQVTSIVSDGVAMYVAMGAASAAPIQKITGNPGSGANFGALRADVLGYCNGRLIAGAANVMFELDAVGAKRGGVNIYSHFSAGFVWTKFLGAPNGIYCCGNNGRTGEIYLCTVADQTGDIIAPYHVGSLPAGETINTMEYYGGVLILATSKGLRLANITGSGFLSIGPLVPIGGDVRTNTLAANLAADATVQFQDIGPLAMGITGSVITCESEQMLATGNPNPLTGQIAVTRGVRGTAAADHAAASPCRISMPPVSVTGLECQGQYVWFTLKQYAGAATGLGRLDLSRFVEPLVPAWAPDLTAIAVADISPPITWRDPVTGRDTRIFATQTSGPQVEFDQYPSFGEYRSGRITYGTAERKAFLSLELWFDPLPAGASIVPLFLDSSGVRHQLASITTTGLKYTKITLPTTEDEWIEVDLILTPGTGNLTTPVVQRWTLRAMPLPVMSEQIKFPVILKNSVDDEGQDLTFDPWGDWDFLHQLYLNRSRVAFVMGNESATVRLDGVSMSRFDPEMVTVDTWTRNREWVEATWYVTLLTVDGGT